MNRWDEIQATARDIASNIHSDPEKVTAMADDLIKLCGLMISAVGKAVAVEGESNVGDPDDDSAYARYRTGEIIEDAAQTVAKEASSAGCDLERWSRVTPSGLDLSEHGWTYTDRRPVMFRHMDDRPVPATDNHRCNECNRIERFGHWHSCSRNSNNSP